MNYAAEAEKPRCKITFGLKKKKSVTWLIYIFKLTRKYRHIIGYKNSQPIYVEPGKLQIQMRLEHLSNFSSLRCQSMKVN